MTNPVDFLLEFFQKYEDGKIFLASGTHVHKIHTKATPTEVWFTELDSGNIPVCNGNINMYGFSLDVDGFIFYAEIMSDSVEIQWQAVLESKV